MTASACRYRIIFLDIFFVDWKNIEDLLHTLGPRRLPFMIVSHTLIAILPKGLPLTSLPILKIYIARLTTFWAFIPTFAGPMAPNYGNSTTAIYNINLINNPLFPFVMIWAAKPTFTFTRHQTIILCSVAWLRWLYWRWAHICSILKIL